MRLIHLILKNSPLDAVFLNGQVIFGAETSSESVLVVAENLALALQIPVESLSGVIPPVPGWDWHDALGLALWDAGDRANDHDGLGR